MKNIFFVCLLFLSNMLFAQKFNAGYCTAGVASLKGGTSCDNGKYICGGVTWGGNAKDWLSNAQAKEVSTGQEARIGAIVVFGANSATPLGHVGVIVSLNPIKMKSMNDLGGLGNWTTRNVSEYPNKKKPVSPIGYIYYSLDKY